MKNRLGSGCFRITILNSASARGLEMPSLFLRIPPKTPRSWKVGALPWRKHPRNVCSRNLPQRRRLLSALRGLAWTGEVVANWRCIGSRIFDFVAGRKWAVCFPSTWRPEEKIGLPVHAIHSTVPTLNENLGARIDKFLANLEPDKAWQRSNWGLSRSSALNQHPTRNIPRLTPPFTDAEAWIRIEDQVLFRLPQTRALLFGIRLVNVLLAELKKFPEAQAGLHRAIATMPDDVADYKNVTEAREHLLELLG